MRTFFWFVGIVIVAMGIYCLPSPPVAHGAATVVRSVDNFSNVRSRPEQVGQVERQGRAGRSRSMSTVIFSAAR